MGMLDKIFKKPMFDTVKFAGSCCKDIAKIVEKESNPGLPKFLIDIQETFKDPKEEEKNRASRGDGAQKPHNHDVDEMEP